MMHVLRITLRIASVDQPIYLIVGNEDETSVELYRTRAVLALERKQSLIIYGINYMPVLGGLMAEYALFMEPLVVPFHSLQSSSFSKGVLEPELVPRTTVDRQTNHLYEKLRAVKTYVMPPKSED